MYIYIYVSVYVNPSIPMKPAQPWKHGPRHGEVCTSAFKDGPKRTDWAPEVQLAPSLDSVHS